MSHVPRCDLAMVDKRKGSVEQWPAAYCLPGVRDHCHMLWEGSTPATLTHEGTQGRGASTGRTQRSHCERGTSSIIKGGRRKDGKEGGRKSTISSSLSSIHCSYTTPTLCLRCVYLFTLLVTLHSDTRCPMLFRDGNPSAFNVDEGEQVT